MRVLVTNDDGVASPGLVALTRAMVSLGHDVVVAAPTDDRSGSSAAIGVVGGSIEVGQMELEGLPDVPAYALDGPPALAVMVARLGAFGDPPDLVASGVNPGANTGRSVLHSGTVGAALTAANFGISGVAVSLEWGEPAHLDTAETVAVAVAQWVARAPAKTVINVNVPNVPLAEIRGVREARLAPFGTVRAALAESRDGALEVELRDTGIELAPDTDTALVGAGYVAVTGLVGVRASDEPGLPEAVAAALGEPAATGAAGA